MDWSHIWSVARYDLGMSDDEFWRMTPREFGAVVKRRVFDIERQDYRAALICATLVNINRKKGSRPVRPEAFLGKKKNADTAAPWQKILKTVEAMNKSFGGKDVRKK